MRKDADNLGIFQVMSHDAHAEVWIIGQFETISIENETLTLAEVWIKNR